MKKIVCLLGAILLGSLVAGEPSQASGEKKQGVAQEKSAANGAVERPFPPPPEMGNKPPMHPGMPRKNPMLSPRMQRVILIMGKLKKENPKEFARLDEMRRKNPRAFVEEIRKYLPKPKAMDRKHQILETECRELAAKIRATKNAAEKEKMTKELRAKLQEEFNLMLSDAMERVTKIQQQIKELKENEEFIISGRLEDMTNN